MILRPATPADAAAMTPLQNVIIAIGGTTAYQKPRREAEVLADYVTDSDVICTHVALDQGGGLLGFQTLGLWQGESHIGTFVDPGRQAGGIGTRLFALTCEAARAAGVGRIVATIRADNRPGLAYYTRIGFRDAGGDPGWALDDGRVVGRVNWWFEL